MSGPDIRGRNVLIAEGVDDWKVVTLFVVNGQSECRPVSCHGPVS